jgi:hypothetical protein
VLEGARHEPTIIVAARGGRVDKIAGRRLDRQPGLNGAAYRPVDFHSGRILVLDGQASCRRDDPAEETTVNWQASTGRAWVAAQLRDQHPLGPSFNPILRW